MTLKQPLTKKEVLQIMDRLGTNYILLRHRKSNRQYRVERDAIDLTRTDHGYIQGTFHWNRNRPPVTKWFYLKNMYF